LALLSAAAPRANLLQGRLACAERRRDHLPALARPSLHAAGPAACVVADDAVRLPDDQARVGLLTLPEAPIAAEDPRFAGLRLLADSGVYFELGRVEGRGGEGVGLRGGGVRPGEGYGVAIPSPGGWWACLSGLFVAFERLSPPIFRLAAGPACEERITSAPSRQ